MKGSEENKGTGDRRGFLKLAAAGTITGGGMLAAAGRPAEAATPTDNGRDGVYRETEHIKRYYDLARF